MCKCLCTFLFPSLLFNSLYIAREDILTELQISQITTEFIYQYKENWKEHVHRMSSDRIPKMILKYQPKGKEI
jgi:hypothetical protein